MKRLGLAACLLVISTCASASDPRFYVGGNLGKAFNNLNCNAVSLGDPCSVDDSSTAWKAYGGFRFNSVAGLELSYFNFGSVKYSGQLNVNNQLLAEPVDADLKSKAIGVGASFHFDLTPHWSTDMRVGYQHVKYRGAKDGTSNPGYLGLDIGYLVAPGLRVLGAWDFTTLKVPTSDYDYRLNVLSVGLSYEF